MNAIRFPDIAEDATLATSRAQRAADPVREWPDFQIHRATADGRFSFDPGDFLGYHVVLVSGPNVTETDGVVYPTWTAALAAQRLLEEAEEPRPEPAVEAMMTELQARFNDQMSEEDHDRQFGRADGFFPDEDEVD